MPVQSKSKSILTFSKELKTVFLNLSFKKNFDLEIATIYIQNCQIRHIIIYFFCKILHDSTKKNTSWQHKEDVRQKRLHCSNWFFILKIKFAEPWVKFSTPVNVMLLLTIPWLLFTEPKYELQFSFHSWKS